MLTKQIFITVLITVLISGFNFSLADEECTAAKPQPTISAEIQAKVKSYTKQWEHSSGHETGLIETIQLDSGALIKISSGGCESYGISYLIIVDGQLQTIPKNITSAGEKLALLKNWIHQVRQTGNELKELGIKLAGLDKITSIKKPYRLVKIYHYPGEVTIELSDEMGFEINSLAFVQKENKKVAISISQSFAL